jgi:hypothetical protein
MKDRTIQTFVANIALTVIIIAVLVYRPETAVLATSIAALLAINGREAIQQHKERNDDG